MLKRQEARRRYRHYSDAEKEQVLLEIKTSGRPVGQIAREHGIESSVVRYWLKKVRESEGNCVPLHPETPAEAEHPLGGYETMARKNEDTTIGMNEAELRAEVLRLQKELKIASLRAEALDVMIDIAERQEGIRIRKKSGAKQS